MIASESSGSGAPGSSFDDDGEAPDAAAVPGPLAYAGTIAHFARGARTGVVRSATGREIPFDLRHVVVAEGLLRGPGVVALEVGQTIGYDVGWTSRGLRVTKLFPPHEA